MQLIPQIDDLLYFIGKKLKTISHIDKIPKPSMYKSFDTSKKNLILSRDRKILIQSTPSLPLKTEN